MASASRTAPRSSNARPFLGVGMGIGEGDRNYYRFFRCYIGIMEKQMETTIMGYIGYRI